MRHAEFCKSMMSCGTYGVKNSQVFPCTGKIIKTKEKHDSQNSLVFVHLCYIK